MQLREVAVLLPAAWARAGCATPEAEVVETNQRAAAAPAPLVSVLAASAQPVLGAAPWTLQHGGCGQPGLGMQLPRAFLDTNTTALAAKSSTFTKEWIKLSFGVFEEEGFEGDSRYPSSFVEGNSNKSNNGCPSKQQVCNIVSALI